MIRLADFFLWDRRRAKMCRRLGGHIGAPTRTLPVACSRCGCPL